MTDQPCPFSLKDVLQADFRDFDFQDWINFPDCKSKDPLIANLREYTVVVDDCDDIFTINLYQNPYSQAYWSWQMPASVLQTEVLSYE